MGNSQHMHVSLLYLLSTEHEKRTLNKCRSVGDLGIVDAACLTETLSLGLLSAEKQLRLGLTMEGRGASLHDIVLGQLENGRGPESSLSPGEEGLLGHGHLPQSRC